MGKFKQLAIELEEIAMSKMPQTYFCVQCERESTTEDMPPLTCEHCGGDDFWHENDIGAPCNLQDEFDRMSIEDQEKIMNDILQVAE